MSVYMNDNVYYIVCKKAVLTSRFIKKLQKTPKAEKELDLILCYRSAKFCGIATFV